EYYVLDNPTVSDGEYDKLYDELRALEAQSGIVLPDSPTLRVGGEPVSAFTKHRHIERLYSLDKAVTEEELRAFDERIKKSGNVSPTYTVEYKFDGLTMCLTYENGYFSRATTRGNGEEGEDVTAQVRTIKTFPLSISYKGTLEVKGEAIIRLSVLKKYNETAAEILKNARNAVAGAIRNLDPKETEKRKPEIYFYDVNHIDGGNIKSQTDGVKFLKDNGFKVFDYLKICKNIEEVITAIKGIEIERKNLDVLTDGAVIKVNDYTTREELGSTEKFPRWAIAYKFGAEEVTTELEDVIWQVGRTGKLTPLGILKPVELCGVTIKKATLNNYGDILRKKIMIPCRALVRRSNDVIPEILGSTEIYDDSKVVEKPKFCPACGTEIIEVGANIFCPNKSCKPRVVASLSNFASKEAMNIDGVSEMTAAQLYDELDVRKFSDLYKLKREQLLGLDGFKDRKTDNFIAAVEKSKKCSLENFIFALGIDGIGKKTAKDLAKKYKDVGALINANYFDLVSLNEIGEVLANNVVAYFSDEENLAEIDRLLSFGVTPEYASETVSEKFKGERVVLTGTLENYKRSEAQKLIEQNGGEVLSSVSKLTTLVLAGENAGSKLDKARSLGIKIIDEREFINILNK
ncbi:MAG: NAD-dependent DNA ligase LigA, partial [Clostridia bacterium]|nr:NAD-dependent DNA ligase LigA [Clostridia bacterium]